MEKIFFREGKKYKMSTFTGAIHDFPTDMCVECRQWYMTHPQREPTYQDYCNWAKRAAEWEEEREMNEMYRLCSDHEDAGDRM